MRRPIRPFVTEYRGSGRRQKDAPAQPLNEHEEHASRAFGGRPPPSSGVDDYEAVLRAADRLFSDKLPRTQPDHTREPFASSARIEHRNPMAEAEAIFSRAPLPQTDVLLAPPPPSDPPAEGTAEQPRESSGGRILQAIEEPADDPFVAMEQELAPKRRGRKPGSKNRPKVLPPAPPPAATTMATAATALARTSRPAASRARAAEGAPAIPALLAHQAPPPAALPIGAAAKPPRVSFAWVRKTLRPGEKWKRRIPKVAW